MPRAAVFLKDDAVLIVDVGIGEIDTEDAVVVGKVGPQEEGLKSIDQQFEMREERVSHLNRPSGPPDEAPMSPWLSNTRKQSSCFIVRRNRIVGSVAGT